MFAWHVIHTFFWVGLGIVAAFGSLAALLINAAKIHSWLFEKVEENNRTNELIKNEIKSLDCAVKGMTELNPGDFIKIDVAR